MLHPFAPNPIMYVYMQVIGSSDNILYTVPGFNTLRNPDRQVRRDNFITKRYCSSTSLGLLAIAFV